MRPPERTCDPGAAKRWSRPRWSRENVLIIVEQLRRLVPGGAGTYAAGVLSGLRQLTEDREHMPPVTLFASRARRKVPTNSDGEQPPDRIAASGFPLIESRLPGPLMTRSWDARLLHAPAGFRIVHATSLAVPPARGARVVVTVHDLVWRHVPFAFPRHGLKWHEHALAEALRRRVEFVVLSRPVADELIEAGAEASARHGDRARKRPPSDCGSRRRIASFGQARHIWRFHPLRQHPRTAKEPSRADRGVLEDPRLLTWSLAARGRRTRWVGSRVGRERRSRPRRCSLRTGTFGSLCAAQPSLLMYL